MWQQLFQQLLEFYAICGLERQLFEFRSAFQSFFFFSFSFVAIFYLEHPLGNHFSGLHSRNNELLAYVPSVFILTH